MPPPEYLAEALVVDIAALKKPLILVLDDFNNIVSEPVHTIVTWAIENLPGRLHLVILSQTDPPLPLERWRVRAWLT